MLLQGIRVGDEAITPRPAQQQQQQQQHEFGLHFRVMSTCSDSLFGAHYCLRNAQQVWPLLHNTAADTFMPLAVAINLLFQQHTYRHACIDLHFHTSLTC
jgi:hypothetical protein